MEILELFLNSFVNLAMLLFEYIGVAVITYAGIQGMVNYVRKDPATRLKLAQGLPSPIASILAGIDIRSENYMFYAVLAAFSLNYAAYFAEIFRGGIESIPKGQYEAAAALGFTKTQTFFRIILPQVVKRIVPASSNEVITLVKDTSIANVVAYAEITLKARQQMQVYSSLVPLIIAGVFYFAMAMILTFVFSLIEKKLSYYK